MSDQEVSMEEEFSECNFCLRKIPQGNLITHEVTCRRHNTVCTECSKIIPNDAMEEHKRKCRLSTCRWCDAEMKGGQLQKHYDSECLLRPIVCEFCNLDYLRCEMECHIEVCGSRTELCAKCQRYVKLIDLRQHNAQSCQHPPAPQTPTFSYRHDADLPNEAGPSSSTNGLFGGIFRRFMGPSTYDRPNYYTRREVMGAGSSTEEHQNNYSAEPDYQGDSYYAPIDVDSLFPPNVDLSMKGNAKELTDEDLLTLPCETCERLLPAKLLHQHQIMCALFAPNGDPSSSALDELGQSRGGAMAGSNAPCPGCGKCHTPMQAILYYYPPGESELEELSSSPRKCRFCDDEYPANLLLDHQDVCLARRRRGI